MRTLAIQRKAVKRSTGTDAPRRASRRGKGRAPLSKEQILRAATLVADRDGLGAVTMRRLGQELGVEEMSLYHHVTNKEEVNAGLLANTLPAVPGTDAGTRVDSHHDDTLTT